MKTCQIMIYGGKHNWIDVSYRKNPNVNWFIFIGVEPEGELPDHWEDIEQKIKLLEAQQKGFPNSEKIKYSYIRLESGKELVSLIRYFRGLINYLNEAGYQVSCNLTAGIFEVRMALYLSSQIESSKISEVFYLNKQSFEKNLLFKSIKISNKGKRLLNIIFESVKKETLGKSILSSYDREYTLSQLRNVCENHGLTMDLPTISRLVSNLIGEGYLKERREGRNKYISLTNIGLIFCPVIDLKKEIQKEL